MRKLLLASTMLVWGSIAFAQEKTVSGKITSSEDCSPLTDKNPFKVRWNLFNANFIFLISYIAK